MARNVEIKARVSDLAGLRSRVASFAKQAPLQLNQRDTFYAVPTGRLKLREVAGDTAELIFYERSDAAGPKLSNYTRCLVPDPIALHQILSAALGVRAAVSKLRDVFFIGQTRVHLDEVEGLGSFVELEVVLRDGQAVKDGELIARDLMAKLGISAGDLVSCAYVDCLVEPKHSG